MSNGVPSASQDEPGVDSVTLQLGELTLSVSRVRRAQAKAAPVPLFGRRPSGGEEQPTREQDGGSAERFPATAGAEEPGPAPPAAGVGSGGPRPGSGSFEDRLLYARGSGRNARRRIDGLRWLPVKGERSELAPRFYVLLRDRIGVVHRPALLYTSWQQISPCVCVDSEGARRARASSRVLDLAVFAGWPSRAEAEEFAA